MKTKYVLKNKRKFYTFIIMLLLIAFTTVFASNAYGYKESTYKVITVKKGDTLWEISKTYGKYKDIRRNVYELKSINNLNSSSILEGSELKVPALTN